MRHDSARDAAIYLAGVRSSRWRRRFEAHLVGCEDCWREVVTGRLGRRVAEAARELAPQELRETVRATIAAAEPARRRRPVALVVAALAVIAFGSATLAVRSSSPSQPVAIALAAEDFQAGRLPGEDPTTRVAPDLSRLQLRLASAGSGTLDGIDVDAFSYRSPQGQRLLLYVGDDAFPVAAGARQASPDGPWRARVDGVELLCAQHPHALLAVSDDAVVLDRFATDLGIDLPA